MIGQRAMTHVAAPSKRVKRRVYEGPGRCRNQVDPRRFLSGHRGDEVIHCILDWMYPSHVHRHATRVPYTSLRFELIPDAGELMPLEVRETAYRAENLRSPESYKRTFNVRHWLTRTSNSSQRVELRFHQRRDNSCSPR